MHEKMQSSLPSLHITTNMTTTKRIHARMEPTALITLPKAQQQTQYHQTFRRVPLKVNPKVVQAFSPYQSYSIMSMNDFLFEKHKKEKQLQRLKERRLQERLKDQHQKEQIKYFKAQEDNNDELVDSIMHRVRNELGQPHQNFMTEIS